MFYKGTQKNKISFLPSPKEFSRGGPKSIANILNQMTVEDAEQYLEQLSMDDPELYTEVKKHFLSFDDLLEMPDHIMKVFWRNPEIDVDDLSKALKGQEQSIIENISSYLSKRNQRKFTEFTEPLSKRDIDSSQLSFVNLARKMNDTKEIKLEDILFLNSFATLTTPSRGISFNLPSSIIMLCFISGENLSIIFIFLFCSS